MRSSVARLVSRSLPAAAVIATLVILVTGRMDGATAWVVSFTIDDTFSPDVRVRSDRGIAYADYRILPAVDAGCIEAAPTVDGHLHATLNRRMPDGTRCYGDFSERQYRIRITGAPVACQKLIAAYGAGVVGLSASACELVETAHPRVRVADLFKKGSPSSTPLAFLADKSGLNGLSYEIKALTNVPMSADGPNRRILVYEGQGMLYEFGNGKARFVAEAFDLHLRMAFERVQVTY